MTRVKCTRCNENQARRGYIICVACYRTATAARTVSRDLEAWGGYIMGNHEYDNPWAY